MKIPVDENWYFSICSFETHFNTIGFSHYYIMRNDHTLDWDKYDNHITIHEEDNGIIDKDDNFYFNKSKKVENKHSKFSEHTDLVGRIVASSVVGVNTMSTTVSTGFHYCDEDNILDFNQSFDWTIAKGSTLINCSWGETKRDVSDPDYIEYFELAYKLDYYSRKYNVTIIKSAGNSR